MASLKDVVVWVLVAHMLVKPHLIDAMRNIVCAEGIEPTVQKIGMVIGRLDRRHGQVKSRMRKAGLKSSWREVDVFGVASTMTHGAKYCGSARLYSQLQEFDKMKSIASSLVSLRRQDSVTFSDVVSAIGGKKLPSYTRHGYWTVHLARLFDFAFVGVGLLGGFEIVYTAECMETLRKMGSGSRSMQLIGITSENATERIPLACSAIMSLAKHCGFNIRSMSPGHFACSICEAHRRNVFEPSKPIQRRKGC